MQFVKSLSARNQRALIILLAFVTVLVLVSYVILPFADARAAIGERVVAKEKELASVQRMVAQHELFRRQLNQLEQVGVEFEDRLLGGTDTNAAEIQVEELVRSLADQHGVRVTRSNPLAERKVGEKYTKLTLQVNLEADVGSLVSFLHALSEEPKFLLVEEFTLTSFRVKDKTRIQPRMKIAGFIRLS